MQATAIDLETYLIQPYRLAPRPVSVAVAHPSHRARLSLWSDWKGLPDGHLVGANVAYDMAVIAEWRPELLPAIWDRYDAGEVHDVQIVERMHDIATRGYAAKSYSLARLATDLLGGVQLDKGDDGWRLRYSELDGVPIEQWPPRAVKYAVDDATSTLEIWDLQVGRGLPADEAAMTRKAWWLHLMACWGMRTDQDMARAFADRLQREHDELAARLVELGLMRAGYRTKPSKVNPEGRWQPPSRDTKAAKDLIESVLGEATPRTEKGAVSTSEDTCLAAVALSPDTPGLREYARFATVQKQLSSDVEIVSKPLIQTRWTVPLETGRVSATQGVLTMSREGSMRACFRPPAGWVYIDADYSGLELSTVAQVLTYVTGSSRLAQAINDGTDPHALVGSQLCGESYSAFVARLKAGDKVAKNLRQTAKVANFGFPGGLGHARFVDYARSAYGVVLSETAARELKELWLASWPEFGAYFDWIRSQLCDVGLPPREDGRADLRIPQLQHFGRKGGSPGMVRANVRYSEACNSLFQGLGASLTGDVGALVSRACYVGDGPLMGCRPCLYVHDQYLIEAPEDVAPEAAVQLRQIMVDGARPWLPDVKLDAEPCLSRYFAKDAVARYDSTGRLIATVGGPNQ